MVVRPAMTLRSSSKDVLFGIGVDAGEGIVEDEDAGIAEDGAGQGGALFLSAGEGEAAFADGGFEGIGEQVEFLANMRGFGGACNVRSRGARDCRRRCCRGSWC